MARPGPSLDAAARVESTLLRIWQTRGLVACLLWPASLLFGWLSGMRRLAFRHGWMEARHPGVPVIVVGNRIVGGAGKTPATIAVIRHLQSLGWSPGLVSRGHGRVGTDAVLEVKADTSAEIAGDEPLLLRRKTGVPVFVHRQRVRAAVSLLAAYPNVDIIVADDGLQHFRLSRDIDIVLVDDRGVGNGWLLPAGPMREPLRAKGTARHTLLLYSAGIASTPLPGHFGRRRLAGVLPLAEWWAAPPTRTWLPMSHLQGRPLLACAGIARPGVFFDALRKEGLQIGEMPLGDHATLSPPPWHPDVPDVVLTEKDAVKLDVALLARSHPHTRVWVAALDFTLDDSFLAALDAALPEPHSHGPKTA